MAAPSAFDGMAARFSSSGASEEREDIVLTLSRIVCETNEHWRSEMLSNRQTHRQTQLPYPRSGCAPRVILKCKTLGGVVSPNIICHNLSV